MNTLIDTLTSPGPPSRAADPKLIERLINAGHITPTGISRRARIRACRNCHRLTIAGLDADLCALEAHCDPYPLTAFGELLATLEHRRTYELRSGGNRGYRLNERDASKIAYASAGSRPDLDVLRQHLCHQRTLTDPEIAPTVHTATTHTNLAPNAQPPF